MREGQEKEFGTKQLAKKRFGVNRRIVLGE
jgi:hypothetical protein